MKTSMVVLVHDRPDMTGGPARAEVPEDGVPAMLAVGWRVEETEPAVRPSRRRGNTAAMPQEVSPL